MLDTEYRYHDTFICSGCGHRVYKAIEDCCRTPYLVVAQDHKYPLHPRLYNQCIHCFGCQNRSKPLSSSKFGNDCEMEFSNERFELWIKERGEESKYIAKLNRECNFQNSKYYKYLEYLDSPEWKDKRKKVLERDENRCQGCKIKPAEQVHHFTYDRLFNEPLEDLVSLCADCHEKEHKVPFLYLGKKT